MVNYYDGVLGSIGVLMTAGSVAAALFGAAAVLPFVIPAVLLVGHALFVAPPIGKIEPSVVAD